MDIVQNYVASDMTRSSKYRRSYKGPHIGSPFPPPPPPSLLHRPFIFPGVITVRHQRSWCGAAGSGLYFQQCVIRHALTPVVYFCDVYSPRENKKKDPNEQRDVDEGPGCKKLYRRPRECHFKELRGLAILLPRGPPSRFGSCEKKARL